MSDTQNKPDKAPENESKAFQEAANKAPPERQCIASDLSSSFNPPQNHESNRGIHPTASRPLHHSKVFYAILWITCVTFLLIYLSIDFQVFYKDHLLTRNLPPLQQRGTLYLISRFTHLFTYTFLAFSMVWTLAKAQKTRAVLYFVLFIELVVLSGMAEQLYILELFDRYPYFLPALVLAIALSLIKLVQEFPLHLSRQTIIRAAIHKRYGYWLIKPLTALLKNKHQLLFLFPAFLIIGWLVPGLPYVIRSWIIIVSSIAVSMGYILAQIDASSHKNLQPLYWWLWALLISALFYLYMMATQLLQLQLPNEIWMFFFTVSLLSIVIACVMTVYITDVLDAALVLRKTFLYGNLLFILLAFFGSMEHFVIHHLAHWLHLNNAVLSSVFAGITGMLFHPLKEKLSHWIKGFEKSQAKE